MLCLSCEYQVHSSSPGTLDKLTLKIDPPKLTPEDEKKLSEASRAAQDAK